MPADDTVVHLDVETPDRKVKKQEPEYSAGTAAGWLLAWFINNLSITLLNKAVFSKLDFHYPYALTAVHMCCNTAGAYMYIGATGLERRQLTPEQMKTVVWFSVLFAANIAVGNASLRHVSVAFNQVMRAMVPGTVMLINAVALKKTFSNRRKFTTIPVVLGVGMACYGDLEYTWIGLALTILAIILAASKAIVSGLVLTGSMRMHPVDLISRMAPLALLWAGLLSMGTGELTEIAARWTPLYEANAITMVMITGVLSFSLNLTSFYSNAATSPLSLCIAGNVKQVVVIVLSIVLFNTTVTPFNGCGILLVCIGGAQYSYVSHLESQSGRK